MYLLDTNIVSYWMRGMESVIDRIRSRSPSDFGLSTITLAEILYGIEKSSVKKKERRLKIEKISSLLMIYPFDEMAAIEYAVIRAELEKKGTIISERDTQIASIALANKLILVTHNVKEFNRIPKLKVEDWAS
ncbi:MAG TPA: type II toxin-antitoxin system VapC family toxin [Deltaproteobacteria bacterium]|nr:type II toxin-antitoxin system VapC family toxin [Deltaproteobacteria bacterium]